MDSIKEIEDNIRHVLDDIADQFAQEWPIAMEDLIMDELAERATECPQETLGRLAEDLDREDLYDDLSGFEVVEALRTKLSDIQIVNFIVELGSISLRDKGFTISSFRVGEQEHEVLLQDSDELLHLVSLLPEGHELRKSVFTVHATPTEYIYLSVKFHKLTKALKPILDVAIAEKSISDILKAE